MSDVVWQQPMSLFSLALRVVPERKRSGEYRTTSNTLPVQFWAVHRFNYMVARRLSLMLFPCTRSKLDIVVEAHLKQQDSTKQPTFVISCSELCQIRGARWWLIKRKEKVHSPKQVEIWFETALPYTVDSSSAFIHASWRPLCWN